MLSLRSLSIRLLLAGSLTLISMFQDVSAQDIFDCKHSRLFADYLFLAQEYQRAANEYERLLFNCDTAQVQQPLLRAYRLSGQYKLAFRQVNRLYPTLRQSPDFVQDEYLKLLLLSERYQETDSLLRTTSLPRVDHALFRLRLNLLTSQWEAASHELSQLDTTRLPNRTELIQLTQQAQLFRPKKTLVAAALSTVVPGSGKFYTRDRKDGLVSFLFIGSLAFQAYRSFHRQGSSSVAGWLFASVGFGFYVGNIYGSVKSARQYNDRRSTQFHNEAKRFTFSSF